MYRVFVSSQADGVGREKVTRLSRSTSLSIVELLSEKYSRIGNQYEGFAQTLADILDQILKATNISVNSIDHRAKDIESFGTKAATPFRK